FQHAVKEKAKKKFLDNRRDCDRENNDHDPLFDAGRGAKELNDVLFARTGPEKPLCNKFSHPNQRVGKEKQHRCRPNSASYAHSEKAAEQSEIKSAEL